MNFGAILLKRLAFLLSSLVCATIGLEGTSVAQGIESSSNVVASAKQYAASGQVDLCFGHLLRLEKGSHEKQCWDITHDLMFPLMKAWNTDNKGPRLQDKLFPARYGAFPYDLLVEKLVRINRDTGSCCVRAGDIIAEEGSVRSMLLASRSIKHVGKKPGVVCSFAYSGDAADLRTVFGAIIICGGDVRSEGDASASLVIARGDITFAGTSVANKCRLVSGKKVTFLERSSRIEAIVEEDQKVPLGKLRVFELSDIGLKVSENKKGIRIDGIDVAISMRPGGVKVGDVVLSVDSAEIRTSDAFRRVIQLKWIGREPVFMSVDRGGETIKLRVEWK